LTRGQLETTISFVTEEEMEAERRRHARAPIQLKVEYKRLNSFFADYTRNISRGGTFIRTQKPLDIGTEFVFQLVVPRLPKPLELRGRVQWVVQPEEGKDPGMGIGFIYKSESERHKIEAEVEKLMVASLGVVLSEKILGRSPKE
jgi:type IV pilus assembly protein PilZ